MIDPKQIRAFFFDVDGTLINYTDHRIHPSDMESLRKLHTRGSRLFIASGRDFGIPAEAAAVSPVSHLMDGYIGANGQQCELADGTLISSCIMDEGDCQRIRKCCEENHLALLYYLGKKSYVTEMTDLVIRFSEHVGLPVHTVRPLSPDEPAPRKLCVYTSEENDRRLLRPLLKHTHTANSNDLISDFIPEGIGKDSGIRDICAYFSIDPQHTMAFGDGENDISMLCAAGIGVAMGNAPENVKAAADFVTAPAEEAGISLALKHFGLL